MQLGSPTGLYGAERWILALIKHLDPEKVESIVAAIKEQPGLGVPLCREAQKLGFRSHVIEAIGRVNLSAVQQLRRYILENRIQVLHTMATRPIHRLVKYTEEPAARSYPLLTAGANRQTSSSCVMKCSIGAPSPFLIRHSPFRRAV